MQLNIKLISLIFCTLYVQSCYNGEISVAQNTKSDFNKEIKRNSWGRPEYHYTLSLERVNEFKLEKIEDGFDSLFIRIWYSYSFDSKMQVFEFKKSNAEWTVEYNLLQKLFNSKDTSAIIQRTISKPQPGSGWDKFIGKLMEFKILSLPTQSDLPSYRSAMDGQSVTVEIATKEYYRSYYYGNPDLNRNIEEVQLLTKIINEIDTELQIKPIHEF